MGDGQEQDHYEERLKEVFNSFDTSGCGSLCPEELSDLCQSLHLDDATPVLLHTLLQNQDHLTARVDFEQFKNALILVLSSAIDLFFFWFFCRFLSSESPEIQPKFVKGSKRYGRRSTPEFTEPISDFSQFANSHSVDEDDLGNNYDSAVPRKREVKGQMHLWNPDEPSTPRRAFVPLSARLEERAHEACEELGISWDGCAGQTELLTLCEHLSLEVNGDVLLSLNADAVMNVQEFVSRVVNYNKPPTPSASTPYRQLKRHHSTQPFDEGGRRIATPSALTSTISMRLFSTLDDGTGYTPAEYILDAWMAEGIENSTEILQALNFGLDGKLSLSDLTMALENELLVTKNGIHQAALASFKAEIRYLLECVDRELREKEKIRSDLEKAEKMKTQLATEVDEHHTAIEHMNSLNLRKLEQDHKEKLAAVRAELVKEMDQIQQQAGLQREELEAEIEKIREDESFLRDHLSISVKENRRLEMELLDSTEKLAEAQSQITKLQGSLDNIMKEKFGDLDPGSADFFLQEERIKQLRVGYEAQCRELQDRIDELQSELQEFQSLGRGNQPCPKPLSEELESKSPGMESDPGIGSEEVQPFSMSLEAEMMLEQLKDQHLQEMEDLRNQLETKVNLVDTSCSVKSHEDQKAALVFQYQQEVKALREEMANVQNHTQELESQLEQVELERSCLEQKQAEEREELKNQQEEEVGSLRQQLLEAHTYTADLEEQLKTLEAQLTELEETFLTEIEELKKQHAKVDEERKKLQEEKAQLEKRLLDDYEIQKELLLQAHEDKLRARLEEAKIRFEEERDEIVKRLTEQWQRERTQLDEQSHESLQVLLGEEMLRIVREQEEKESNLKEQWEIEQNQLQERHEEALLNKILQERLQMQEQYEQREKRLKEEWERERLQLEEDYEGMLQDRLNEDREKLETEKEEMEKKLEGLMAEERAQVEASHQEAMRELIFKHIQERDALSSMLDKLREDIVKADEETLQAVNHQSARLKTDLRVLQQDRDSLKHEVAVLHKQLQNANDKNHVLEMALHSTGLQNQSKKLYRDEMSRLMGQEQQLLRQENDRLQAEMLDIRGELMQSRERVRQLDATVLSLKQHKQHSQSSLVKALEQENTSLKHELGAQKELTKVKTACDERERKMKNMEERMREIELSLRNVKLLLKEKVAQLKDQLYKNGKADGLIKDLYVENAQLLKALEITEQRQKIAEKKNYLLEEKISSLNKIVRDLNPSPLPVLPYHYKCT
uniref:Ninein (GSK3B interacting protein) n=1 Tax=Mastacembelus armatus TaxID=205130 RepID=A0A7N8Y3J6_9TELE